MLTPAVHKPFRPNFAQFLRAHRRLWSFVQHSRTSRFRIFAFALDLARMARKFECPLFGIWLLALSCDDYHKISSSANTPKEHKMIKISKIANGCWWIDPVIVIVIQFFDDYSWHYPLQYTDIIWKCIQMYEKHTMIKKITQEGSLQFCDSLSNCSQWITWQKQIYFYIWFVWLK